MKRFLLSLSSLFLLFFTNAQSSSLVQTLKGIIMDKNSEHPLPNATVTIDGLPGISAISDSSGVFKLRNVPVGRCNLKVTSAGYEEAVLSNIEVTSSKEVVVEIKMNELIKKLNEIVIRGGKPKAGAINESALVSSRQFSMDEAIRYSGTRNDPSRMVQNYAGVSGNNDARNDIVIRGNSPSGVLWRLDGIDIPNPNHFSTLGATGGPVSMLNTNTLKNSDFLTSAFPAQYGNAIAGVFDLRMRNGNDEKYEFTGEMGFNGFEFGAEGPLKKDTKASFLFDYRYSMVAAIQSLGLSVGTGSATPYYQDVNFKLNIPTKNAGTFSWFGLGGESHIHFTPESQLKDNLYAANDGSVRDRKFNNYTGVTGFTHQYFFTPETYGRLMVAVSAFQSKDDEDIIEAGKTPKDAFDNKYIQLKYSVGYQVNSKLNKRDQLTAGITFDINQLKLKQDLIRDGDSVLSNLISTNESATLIKGFINLGHRFSNKVSTNLGIYSQWFTLNNTAAVEPRWNLRYQFKNRQAISVGLGIHSQLQPLEVYFYKNQYGQQTNKNLSFVRSLHSVIGYDLNISRTLRFKYEAYAQYIYDAAVEKLPSAFSMLNEGAGFGFPNKTDLFNSGKGYNYGLELTLEKFLQKGLYYLVTGSVFESKYKGSDDILRNTVFNTNYTLNLLAGKEVKLNGITSFAIDSKFTIAGGQRYTPFDLQQSRDKGYVVYRDQEAFSLQQAAYKRWDLKFSYIRNKKRSTQKWYIDFQNLTNNKNVYVNILNPKTGSVSTINQIGFFPNLNYSITF